MNFKDEIVKITKWKKTTETIIAKIKTEITKRAENGYWDLDEAYKLEADNKLHMYASNTRILVDHVGKIPMTEKDTFVYKQFKDMDFEITFYSVNLNPYPEMGQEGYSACFYMNIGWK